MRPGLRLYPVVGLLQCLKEMDELIPRMPGLAGHYESTDGAGGQFQGETNCGSWRAARLVHQRCEGTETSTRSTTKRT
jgi:hypothetical protein